MKMDLPSDNTTANPCSSTLYTAATHWRELGPIGTPWGGGGGGGGGEQMVHVPCYSTCTYMYMSAIVTCTYTCTVLNIKCVQAQTNIKNTCTCMKFTLSTCTCLHTCSTQTVVKITGRHQPKSHVWPCNLYYCKYMYMYEV